MCLVEVMIMMEDEDDGNDDDALSMSCHSFLL